MSEEKIVLLFCVGYIVMAIFTSILAMVIDRKSGVSAEEVYGDISDYYTYGLLWVICLPLILGYGLYEGFKHFSIAVTEVIVSMNGKEEEGKEQTDEKDD